MKEFVVQIEDKTAWKELKEDLKAHFKEIGIRYKYSLESPTFHILYESETIKIKIIWEEDGKLTFEFKATNTPTEEEINILSEIFDLLSLFEAELIKGKRPEEW